MASPTGALDQLVSSTLDNWRKTLTDQTIKQSAVLAALESKGKITLQGGSSIKMPLLHAFNDTVKSFADYDLFDTTPQGGLANATYPWKQAVGTVTISGTERRVNNGPEAFIDLLSTKFKQLEAGFVRYFNLALFAGTSDSAGGTQAVGAKDFYALNTVMGITAGAPPTSGNPLVGGATTMVGGLDALTDATFWKSVIGGSMNITTTAGIKQLNNVVNSLWINGSVPDFHFTTQANYEAFEALMPPFLKFNDTKMGDLGFQALSHKGAEVVFDPFVPAPTATPNSLGGYWYCINSKYLDFVRHSQSWMTRLDTQRPYNQDAYSTPIICMGNLVTSLRRAHALIPTVTV